MDAREFERQFKARAIPDKIEPHGLTCLRCFDCGFCWIDCDGIACWAYCRCKEGKIKYMGFQFKLPLYDYEMERLFKYKSFPIKAFTPSNFVSMRVGLDQKVRDFKNDLRLSEKFWLQAK